jgi:ligand-binding sensor domain-containing protein/serine phosphatase RsbU (regulator of sigma subunit)
VNKKPLSFLYTLVLFLFFSLINSVFSQTKTNTSIKIYNQDNGIVSNFCQSVKVDKNNFIWIGTQAGLNKFNGYNFDLYTNEKKNENSLGFNDITALFEDKDNQIWIGTANGLNRLDKVKNKIYRIKINAGDTNKIVGASCINQNLKGQILVGGFLGKLFLGDAKSLELKKIKTSITEAIYSIVTDEENNSWIGSDGNGLLILKNNSKTLEQIKIINTNKAIKKITSLCFIEKNTLLIGTREDGVYSLNTKSLVAEKIQSLKEFKIKCVFKDSKQRIWVGTDDRGLFVKEPNSKEFELFEKSIFKPTNNLYSKVTSISEDFQGNIWLTCIGGGLIQINFHQYPFKLLFKTSTEYEIVDNTSVLSLFINEKNEYCCGLAGGDLILNTPVHKNLVKNFKNLGVEPFSIFEQENIYYIGTSSGVFKLDKKTGDIKKINFSNLIKDQKMVIEIKELDNKIIFVYYGGGLSYLDQNSGEIISGENNSNLANLVPFSLNSISDLAGKYYLAGTVNSGLIILDKSFKFIRAIESPQINDQYVLNAKSDSLGHIWIGLYNGGGVDYIENGLEVAENPKSIPLVYNFNRENGLQNGNIMSLLLEDNKNIWVSTGKGIFKINVSENFFKCKDFDLIKGKESSYFSIKSYLSSDGLPCNDFNFGVGFKDKNNLLYFGGINGVVYFNPKKLTMNTKAPIVSLTNFKVFGSELKLDTNITYKKQLNLSYSQNIFSIDFVALDYSSPEKNQFAYKLEGFDKDWIYSGQRRFANYTNIDPGEYIFKVKASNNDGVWNEKGIELKISIAPPFYKTKWFYSLCTILFFSLIYTFIKRREIQLKKENKLLESKVTQRTKEIEDINSVLYKKNRDITDSINYAKRIQDAFLLPEFELKKLFKDAFIFFNPKDIVSGDFYWFTKEDNSNGEEGIDKLYLVAVADCTGHGVPGALMSMIGIDRLSDCSKKTSHPGKILKLLNQSIKDSLRQSIEYSEFENSESETTRDGMDISLCQIAYMNNGKIRVRYSGANRPIWIISNLGREINEIKHNKTAIGGFTAFDYFYEEQELYLEKGDKIYMFTDGYCDQFGGPSGKKFLIKRFRIFISSISHLPMFQQLELLDQELQKWMGNEDQVDDLLVIGFTL